MPMLSYYYYMIIINVYCIMNLFYVYYYASYDSIMLIIDYHYIMFIILKKKHNYYNQIFCSLLCLLICICHTVALYYLCAFIVYTNNSVLLTRIIWCSSCLVFSSGNHFMSFADVYNMQHPINKHLAKTVNSEINLWSCVYNLSWSDAGSPCST